ncbi:restriction endonuclease subunit S, partial [Metamycoplasma hyosynoviae]
MLYKLSEIASVIMGQSPKSSSYNSDMLGLPFLQGGTTFGDKYPYFDIWTTEWNKEANPNDILFTVRAPVGDLNIANTKIAIGRGIAAIRPKKVTTLYLYYLLQTNKHIFLTSSVGTIFDSINKDALESVYLDIHKEQDQHHIVNTIGSVDNLIEN